MGFNYSTAVDEALVWEGMQAFNGGVDALNRGILLGENQCQLLENAVITDSLMLMTRPGIAKVFDGGFDGDFGDNVMQGMAFFERVLSGSRVQYLVACGHTAIKSWNNTAWADVTGYTPSSETVMLEMVQGGDYLYLTDGVNNWSRWDGSTMSDLGNLVGVVGGPPKGATIGCWHTRRMFATGDAANPDTVWASYIGDAGSDKWDHVRFSFRVGYGDGEPNTSLTSLQGFWLLVGKIGSLWLVNADPTAVEASSITDGVLSASSWPIQMASDRVGVVGKRAAVRVGNDVLFLSHDGIRSLKRMATGSEQFEVNPPISLPVQPYIDRINWQYAYRTTAWQYGEHVFFGLPLDTATWPDTTLVWNARHNCWSGVFTGWKPTCWATTRFSDILSLHFGDTDGFVQQWQDGSSWQTASTFNDNGSPVPFRMRTKAFAFGVPTAHKTVRHTETDTFDSMVAGQAMLVGDENTVDTWSLNAVPVTNQLPVNLPFNLATLNSTRTRRSVYGAGRLREISQEVTAQGKIGLRAVSIGAFMDAAALKPTVTT